MGSCQGYLVVVEIAADVGIEYFFDEQTMALVGVQRNIAPNRGDSCFGVRGFEPPQDCPPLTTKLCP
jgi:hypothetical protein